MSWPFFVRHYDDRAQQERDDKFRPEQDGVLYPRSGTLGGCTAHNAMITVYPHDADWDGIAAATGDPSWRSTEMRRWFEQLEACDYKRRPRMLPRHPLAGRALLRRAAVRQRQVRQPQPARLRRLAAHHPRRPRARPRRQAGHLA